MLYGWVCFLPVTKYVSSIIVLSYFVTLVCDLYFSQFLYDSFLLKHEGLALPTLRMCLEAFTWTDGEAVTKISSYCSALVVLAIVTNHAELIEYVSRDLFTSIIKGLALESNAIISADLVGICREIFVYLCDRHPAPRQVSMCLVLLATVFFLFS